MLIYLILGLSFASILLLFYNILSLINSKRETIRKRLKRISDIPLKKENEELDKSLVSRIIIPVLDSISRFVLKITPKELISSFEKKVVTAGMPYRISAKGWINIRAVIIVILPLLTITAGYVNSVDSKRIMLLCIAEAAGGLILPSFILSRKTSERKRKIKKTLPDIIDLLTVSVEAGLGFDGALIKVIEKFPGDLAEELEKVIQEIKMGKPKKDALKSMAERVDVSDLTTFTGSIIQAEQFGVSIGNVLRIQSEQMRQKRKQLAQEKAMKAPVKMLIPMVLFIFPTIFSVLLGPIAIKIMDTFLKL
jgi:tight adherence protein C